MNSPNKFDARKLSIAEITEIREQVILQHRQGKSKAEISRITKLSYSAVRKIVNLYLIDGLQAIKPKTRGRALGQCRRLSLQQELAIQACFWKHTPHEYKLNSAYWDHQFIHDLIVKLYKISLPKRTLDLYIQRWGFGKKSTPPGYLVDSFEIGVNSSGSGTYRIQVWKADIAHCQFICSSNDNSVLTNTFAITDINSYKNRHAVYITNSTGKRFWKAFPQLPDRHDFYQLTQFLSCLHPTADTQKPKNRKPVVPQQHTFAARSAPSDKKRAPLGSLTPKEANDAMYAKNG